MSKHRLLSRLFGGGRAADDVGRAANEARAADLAPSGRWTTRLPETTTPLRNAPEGASEVAATRRYRQQRLDSGRTTPGASPDEVAAAQRDRLRTERHVRDRSATREPDSPTGTADAPTKPRTPLLSQQTRSNLFRVGSYSALGLGSAAVATGIADWWTDNVTVPRTDARTRELDAQTPKVDDAGPCAKIVRAPGESTLLDDAACRAERMREFLRDGSFRDHYERYFLDGKEDPGGVEVTSLTTRPPTLGQRMTQFAIGAALISLVGVGAWAAWRYYKAHPEKFKKKPGTRVDNPASKSKPAAAPA